MNGVELKSKDYFEKLFKEFYNPLCNYVNRFINDREDCKEIVQNTFLRIWENREQLKITTSVKGYLYRATKNSMIDFIRKNKNVQSINEDVLHKVVDDNPDELSPYLIRSAIIKASNKLKMKNKEIFLLHKFEGLTYPEIAKHLGISKRAVEDNIARAYRILRDELRRNPNLFQ